MRNEMERGGKPTITTSLFSYVIHFVFNKLFSHPTTFFPWLIVFFCASKLLDDHTHTFTHTPAKIKDIKLDDHKMYGLCNKLSQNRYLSMFSIYIFAVYFLCGYTFKRI